MTCDTVVLDGEIVTFCISEVSCRRVGEAVALKVSVPLTGEFRLM